MSVVSIRPQKYIAETYAILPSKDQIKIDLILIVEIGKLRPSDSLACEETGWSSYADFRWRRFMQQKDCGRLSVLILFERKLSIAPFDRFDHSWE